VTHEDRAHLEELLPVYRRRLQVLELQAAQFGIYAPPHITLEIDDLKAKIHETELHLGSAQPAQAAPRQGPKLSSEQLRQLTELMLALPSMGDRSTRDAVLQQLPGRITNAIRRHDSARVDVLNIALTVANYEQGLTLLVDAVRFFDGGTAQLTALEAFLNGSIW
jgi:hypothetical protein